MATETKRQDTYSVPELARELRCPVEGLYRLHAEGAVPAACSPPGASLRWRKADVAAWLREGCPRRGEKGGAA